MVTPRWPASNGSDQQPFLPGLIHPFSPSHCLFLPHCQLVICTPALRQYRSQQVKWLSFCYQRHKAAFVCIRPSPSLLLFDRGILSPPLQGLHPSSCALHPISAIASDTFFLVTLSSSLSTDLSPCILSTPEPLCSLHNKQNFSFNSVLFFHLLPYIIPFRKGQTSWKSCLYPPFSFLHSISILLPTLMWPLAP